MGGAAGDGIVGYLTGEYPKVSHTFIQREVQALREHGVRVKTYSVRRPAASAIMADQRAEEQQTFYVLEHARNIVTLLGAHIALFAASPRRWLGALATAFGLRSPGMKGMLYQLFYFAEAGVLAVRLKADGVSHLHNHFGNSSCSVAVLASALSGVPYSFTEHGPAVFFEAEKWHLDTKIARASFVVAISHFCRSQLMLFSHPDDWQKIKIVHCGIELEHYGAKSAKTGALRVVAVGRLEPVKGFSILLEAFARVVSQRDDVVLEIVGDGVSRADLEARSRQLGIADMVSFVGYRTQAEVAGILAEADVFVLPSFAEGVPVVLMEAMASQVPVISSRVAGISELVEDGISGFLVPPGDTASLALRLKQMLTSHALRQSMGVEGRTKVQNEFDVRREAERLKVLFAKSNPQSAAEYWPEGPIVPIEPKVVS